MLTKRAEQQASAKTSSIEGFAGSFIAGITTTTTTMVTAATGLEVP